MSDGVLIALFGSITTIVTVLGVPIINHVLGRKDRALASKTVAELNTAREAERKVWLRKESAYLAEIRRCGGTVPSGMLEALP